MKVISIDIGATSGRVMVVEENNSRLTYREINRFDNRIYEKDNTLYWDFLLLIDNIKEGIQMALSKEDDIESIGIDTWAVDYGVIDKEGSLIEDPLCYRDTHTFEKQKEVLARIPFKTIYSKVGIQNLHFNTIYQLYKDDRLKEGNRILLIPDLISYFLTGSIRMEETNASTTSLYDFRNKRMDPELLNALDIPSDIFPPLIFPGEEYGELKEEYYPKGYKGKKVKVLAVATHDTASAVLGTNGEGQFAYLSSGTWSLLGTELKDRILSEESRKADFTNEIGFDSTVRYLKNTMGMFLINEVRNDFRKKGTEIKVSDIKRHVDESEDIDSYLDTNDPVFETPGDMICKIDRYLEKTHQTKPKDKGQYLRLIYQSMALSYRKLVDTLEYLTKHKVDKLIIVGGGNQAVVLNQYTANSLNREVKTGPIEATVIGNAVCQFIHHKVFKDIVEARKAISESTEGKYYLPKDSELWNRKYERFLTIINGGNNK